MLRPLIDQAIEVTTMENAERRVLALTVRTPSRTQHHHQPQRLPSRC